MPAQLSSSKPRRRFYARNRNYSKLWRKAFLSTISAYNQIRATVGHAQAIDYSHTKSGSFKSSSDNGKILAAVDYTVDVNNTAKNVLNADEFKYFQDNLQDKQFDMTVQSESFIRLQEKLGRAFLGRRLYPVGQYFEVIKK